MPSTPVEVLSVWVQLLAPDRLRPHGSRHESPHPIAPARNRPTGSLVSPNAHRDFSYLPCFSPPLPPFLGPSSFTRLRLAAAAYCFSPRPYLSIISFFFRPSSSP